MATALDTGNLDAVFEEDSNNHRARMLDDWTPPNPARYVVRTIDIKRVGTELIASFRDSGYVQNLGTQDIRDVVRGLVPVTLSGPELSAPGASPTTPLDLQLKNYPTYVIFVLGEPSNMRFNPDKKAMSHKNRDDRNNYGRLRHVIATREDEDPLDDCRVVYFVAKPLSPPATDYKHGFNLNVRLDQGLDQDGNARALDIEIDPDIRYPGGSVTEP